METTNNPCIYSDITVNLVSFLRVKLAESIRSKTISIDVDCPPTITYPVRRDGGDHGLPADQPWQHSYYYLYHPHQLPTWAMDKNPGYHQTLHISTAIIIQNNSIKERNLCSKKKICYTW